MFENSCRAMLAAYREPDYYVNHSNDAGLPHLGLNPILPSQYQKFVVANGMDSFARLSVFVDYLDLDRIMAKTRQGKTDNFI